MQTYEMPVKEQADEVREYRYGRRVLATAAVDSLVSIVVFIVSWLMWHSGRIAGGMGFIILVLGVVLFFALEIINAIDVPTTKSA